MSRGIATHNKPGNHSEFMAHDIPRILAAGVGIVALVLAGRFGMASSPDIRPVQPEDFDLGEAFDAGNYGNSGPLAY